MKLPKDVQRKLVWEALFRADGDRNKAASSLGVSLRTFYRWLSELELHADMEKMGWVAKPGPPRGLPKGSSVVRTLILAHLQRRGGAPDFGELSMEIYKEDNRTTRQRLYSALEDMKSRGRVEYDEKKGIWIVKNVPIKRETTA